MFLCTHPPVIVIREWIVAWGTLLGGTFIGWVLGSEEHIQEICDNHYMSMASGKNYENYENHKHDSKSKPKSKPRSKTKANSNSNYNPNFNSNSNYNVNAREF